MVKRGNERSQLSKEDYDAIMERDESSGPSGSFERASADVISQRKIRKVRRPDASSANQASGSERKNPFGGVSFGSGVGFQGFGGGQQTTKAAGASGDTSRNVSLVGKTILSAPTSESAPTQNWFGQPQPAKQQQQSSETGTTSRKDTTTVKLTQGVFSFIDKQVDENRRVIPTRALDIFLTTINALENNGTDAVAAATAIATTKHSPVGTQGTTSAPTTAAPLSSSGPTAGPLFGNNTSTSTTLFGQPSANASSTPKFSFTTNSCATMTNPAASSTLSFGSLGAPAKGSVPAPFSFSKTPSPATSFQPATEGNNTSAEDKNQSSVDVTDGDNGDAVAVLEAKDPEWDTVSQVEKAKLRRHGAEKGTYVDVCIGKLSLQKHKTNGTRRLLFRGVGTGSVLANLMVNESTEFTLNASAPGEKNPRGHIIFMSCLDANKGAEILYLVTKYPHLKETAQKLISLTKA